VNRGVWTNVASRAGSKPSVGEKLQIIAACDKLIADVLRPRYLPEIRPSQFNYPVAMFGKWHGNKYRFIMRFRSDDPTSCEPEFEAPFARLEYVRRDCFDISWYRHPREWLCVFERVSLTEALHLIETDSHFEPC
jgi:hypothetical protein